MMKQNYFELWYIFMLFIIFCHGMKFTNENMNYSCEKCEQNNCKSLYKLNPFLEFDLKLCLRCVLQTMNDTNQNTHDTKKYTKAELTFYATEFLYHETKIEYNPGHLAKMKKRWNKLRQIVEKNSKNLVVEQKGKNGRKQFFTLTYFKMMNRILTKYEEKSIHLIKCESCSDTKDVTKMLCCEKFIGLRCVYKMDDENKACKFCQQKIRKDKIKFFDFLGAILDIELRDVIPTNEHLTESQQNGLYLSSKQIILHEIMIRKENNDVTKLLRIQVESILLKVLTGEKPNEDYIFDAFEEKEDFWSEKFFDIVSATVVSTLIHSHIRGWDNQIIEYLPFYCFSDLFITCVKKNTRHILPDACTKDIQSYHKTLYYTKFLLFFARFLATCFPYIGVSRYIPVLLILLILLKVYLRDLS